MNINLDFTNKKILIVGAGKVALRRLRKIVIQKKECKIKIISPLISSKINLIGTNIYPDLNENISAVNKRKLENSINNINKKSNFLNYERLSENIEKLRITNSSKK